MSEGDKLRERYGDRVAYEWYMRWRLLELERRMRRMIRCAEIESQEKIKELEKRMEKENETRQKKMQRKTAERVAASSAVSTMISITVSAFLLRKKP